MSDAVSDQGLPASLLAERAVLGAILMDSVAFNHAAEILKDDDFHLDSHRKIYRGMRALSLGGQAIDYVTLTEALKRDNDLEAVGGYGYLLSLTDALPRSVNVEHYARIVKDRAILRRLLAASAEISSTCLAGADDTGAILDQAQKLIFDIAEDRVRGGLVPVSEIASSTMQKIDQLRGKSNITGLGTGYRDFDQLTAGLQPGELIIIAARPSMGKTSFAMNIVENACMSGPRTAAVFSLEMSSVQLVLRMLCSTAHVNAHRLRTGFITHEDTNNLLEAMGKLTQTRIYIDDTAGIDATTMRAQCRRLKAEHGLDLVVVDYLQLMSSSGKVENRTLEISGITRSLKGMAKELNVPVVALSQLSRAPEQRKGKPMLSDLRESGAIEQDADLVAFIYRRDYYEPEDCPEEEKGTAEIIIAKQRNGPTDTIRMAFLRDYTRFETLASGADTDGPWGSVQ